MSVHRRQWLGAKNLKPSHWGSGWACHCKKRREGTAVVRTVEHMGWEQLWGLCMQLHKWGGSFGPKIYNWAAGTWFWACHYKRQRDVMEGVSRVGCMG